MFGHVQGEDDVPIPGGPEILRFQQLIFWGVSFFDQGIHRDH